MHTTRRLATVLGFASVGMLIAVWLHDYTIEVVRQNDELRAINTELINNQYTYMKLLTNEVTVGTKLYTIVKGEAG